LETIASSPEVYMLRIPILRIGLTTEEFAILIMHQRSTSRVQTQGDDDKALLPLWAGQNVFGQASARLVMNLPFAAADRHPIRCSISWTDRKRKKRHDARPGI
jgi:hypothetical protein